MEYSQLAVLWWFQGTAERLAMHVLVSILPPFFSPLTVSILSGFNNCKLTHHSSLSVVPVEVSWNAFQRWLFEKSDYASPVLKSIPWLFMVYRLKVYFLLWHLRPVCGPTCLNSLSSLWSFSIHTYVPPIANVPVPKHPSLPAGRVLVPLTPEHTTFLMPIVFIWLLPSYLQLQLRNHLPWESLTPIPTAQISPVSFFLSCLMPTL